MRTIVGGGTGALVGEIVRDGRKILVLSDPDLLSNRGLGRGDNSLFMLAMIERLRMWNNDDPGAPLVFDERSHGWQEARGSPLRLLLFTFPFSIVTALICCSAILLVLSGAGRFGVPRPYVHTLGFGRANLIDNSARLLDYGGHHEAVLRRYARMTVRAAALALHAPGGLDENEMIGWLDKAGAARGAARPCSAIMRAVTGSGSDGGRDLSKLFECAREIYRWKGEILIGSATDRRRHQGR
jgi:hypothetical protein